jgi:hypothetical protein
MLQLLMNAFARTSTAQIYAARVHVDLVPWKYTSECRHRDSNAVIFYPDDKTLMTTFPSGASNNVSLSLRNDRRVATG